MSLKTETILRLVLYEGENSRPLESGERFAAVAELLQQGFALTCSGEATHVTNSAGQALLVLGKFGPGSPSAAPSNGDGPVQFLDLETVAPGGLAAAVENVRLRTQTVRQGEWKPWFPVIDYDRCTNCMQCLSFCLFDVYGVDGNQKIQVQNNDNCKTNCPACSRVCPEAAIMFPKYKAGPINGDIVSEGDLEREKMKIDISALLGGDIYQMLRDRSEKAKSRFSKERDADKALKERQKCLVKLQEMGDIPAEVLLSLPKPEEIQRRAQEAAAKAQAALTR